MDVKTVSFIFVAVIGCISAQESFMSRFIPNFNENLSDGEQGLAVGANQEKNIYKSDGQTNISRQISNSGDEFGNELEGENDQFSNSETDTKDVPNETMSTEEVVWDTDKATDFSQDTDNNFLGLSQEFGVSGQGGKRNELLLNDTLELNENITHTYDDHAKDLGPHLTGEEEEMINTETEEVKKMHIYLDDKVNSLAPLDETDGWDSGGNDESAEPKVSLEDFEKTEFVSKAPRIDKPIHENGDVHPSSSLSENMNESTNLQAVKGFSKDENNFDSSDSEDSQDLQDDQEANEERAENDDLDSVSRLDEQEVNKKQTESTESDQMDESSDQDVGEDQIENTSTEVNESDYRPVDKDQNENTDSETSDLNSNDSEQMEGDTAEDIYDGSKTDNDENQKSPDYALLIEGEDEINYSKEPIVCGFEQPTFQLSVTPKSGVIEHGTDITLNCTLYVMSNSTLPSLTLSWDFEKFNCSSSFQSNKTCLTELTSKEVELSPFSQHYYLTHKISSLDQTLHGGKYICWARITSCQPENANLTSANTHLHLKVYVKPNYVLHIGIISGVCLILLVILAGLVVYSNKVQARSKHLYRELLSIAEIQFQPAKGLELPNAVYNPTTVKFTSMTPSPSKSSFSSVEDV